VGKWESERIRIRGIALGPHRAISATNNYDKIQKLSNNYVMYLLSAAKLLSMLLVSGLTVYLPLGCLRQQNLHKTHNTDITRKSFFSCYHLYVH